jgi:hypothetical protein
MLARSIAAVLLAVGLLGCLRVFGPDLRPVGPHVGLSGAGSCMDCHESEADAIVRIAQETAKLSAAPPSHTPPKTELGPPLVADWMVAEARPCTDCHRVRR